MNSNALRIAARIAAWWFGLGLLNATLAVSSARNGELTVSQKLGLSRAIQVAYQLQPAQSKRSLASPGKHADRMSSSGFGAIAGTVRIDDEADSAFVIAYTTDPGQTFWRGYAGVQLDGSYLIEQLVPGEYFVVAQADEYLPQYYDGASSPSEAKLVIVAEGDTTMMIDFTLQKSAGGKGSISGRVVSALDGTAIAGATVYAFSMTAGIFYRSAVSLENGTYRVTDLYLGKYIVAVWADGFRNEFYDNVDTPDLATLVTVSEPSDVGNIDFALGPGSMISGHVNDMKGNPLAGVLVWAYVPAPEDVAWPGFGEIHSEADGSYKVTGLKTGVGDYVAMAYGRNDWSQDKKWYVNTNSESQAKTIEVVEGQAVNHIDITLDLRRATSTIAGSVTDSHGRPLAEAFVYASSWLPHPDSTSVNRACWGQAYTDSDGQYQMEVARDAYKVRAHVGEVWYSPTQWYPGVSTPDSAQPLIVEDGTNLSNIDFHLTVGVATAKISGQVTATDGRPLAWAFISLGHASQHAEGDFWVVRAQGETDEAGNYSIEHLPPGEYVAQAQYWWGYDFDEQWYLNAESRAGATLITLADSQQVDHIDFVLTPRPILGEVSDDVLGGPLARAYVEATPLRADSSSIVPVAWWPWNTITDNNGYFFGLESLPRGDYLFSVYSDGAFQFYQDAIVPESATTVSIGEGFSQPIAFAMKRRKDGHGTISGMVRDESSNKPPGIAIILAKPAMTSLPWPQSELFYTAVTDTLGSFTLSGLAPGDYLLTCFAPGYVGEYYDNVFDPSEAAVVRVDGQQPVVGIHFALAPSKLLPAPPQSNDGVTGVFGRITGTEGKNIWEAMVHVFNETGQPVAFGRSGAEGYYEINGLPSGAYRVMAGHPQYLSRFNGSADELGQAQLVEIALDRKEIDFVLKPKVQSGVDGREAPIPKTVELYGNYPNPFNPETRISFGLPVLMSVKVRVFNLLGEEVSVLVDDMRPAGVQHIEWNGRDRSGREVGSGLYFYRVETTRGVLHGKMLLMR